MASDGGWLARGTGPVASCIQGGIWEDWQPATSSNRAIDHGIVQRCARKRGKHAKEPVIGGFKLPCRGEVPIRIGQTGKA
jgi:hypothetical protein